jgi:mono/diheme cytochrome c family protein
MRRHLLLSLLAVVVIGSAAVLAQTTRRAAPPASAAGTFTETIAPILYANCVTCHRPGQAAPFSLISYEDVAKRGALITRVTESRYMPPWHETPSLAGSSASGV